MATITTSAPYFYKNGSGGVSGVVGYESSSNRVARYSFTSPSTGASAVSLTMPYVSSGGGSTSTAIRFYITTSSSSHTNAGASSGYHGTFSITLSEGVYWPTGSASVLLLPNTTYYLWCFPGSTTYGWWYWSGAATINTSGGAGLVRIDNGSSFVNAMPYIDNGSSWVQAMPYIDNGSSWVLCS